MGTEAYPSEANRSAQRFRGPALTVRAEAQGFEASEFEPQPIKIELPGLKTQGFKTSIPNPFELLRFVANRWLFFVLGATGPETV